MLFSENTLSEYVLIDLAKEIRQKSVPPINPLPCDRWVARSCLQKAIRRAQPALAHRALANLFTYDRRATWRHLAIIALEDVGVAGGDLLARIVAAQRDRKWREQAGGDWIVMAELVRQMAESGHCQAACDLLLRITNDPQLESARVLGLEAELDETVAVLRDAAAPLIDRGIAALAMGGGLAEGQPNNDACGVFDLLSDTSRSADVVANCRAAWKLTRNPMALLLPLVSEQWSQVDRHGITNDPLPPTQMIGDVPGYALDQFTRRGKTAFRALVASEADIRTQLDEAGVPKSMRASVVGDLIFLLEGGKVRRRLVWPCGDTLRLPHRWLPAVAQLGSHLSESLRLIEAKVSQIALERLKHQHPS